MPNLGTEYKTALEFLINNRHNMKMGGRSEMQYPGQLLRTIEAYENGENYIQFKKPHGLLSTGFAEGNPLEILNKVLFTQSHLYSLEIFLNTLKTKNPDYQELDKHINILLNLKETFLKEVNASENDPRKNPG